MSMQTQLSTNMDIISITNERIAGIGLENNIFFCENCENCEVCLTGENSINMISSQGSNAICNTRSNNSEIERGSEIYGMEAEDSIENEESGLSRDKRESNRIWREKYNIELNLTDDSENENY